MDSRELVHYVQARDVEEAALARSVAELLNPGLVRRRRQEETVAHAQFLARQAEARARDARFRWLAFGAGAALVLGPAIGLVVAVVVFGMKVLVISGGIVLLALLGGPRRLARGVGGGLNTMILRWRT